MFSFLFETALKKYCELNPSIATKIAEKSILITLLPLNKHWKIIFNRNNVVCYLLSAEEVIEQPVNLKIAATPQALIAMLLRGDRTGLKIEGDVVLAQTLEHSFSEIADPKILEKIFQENLGDVSFYPIKTLFKKGFEHLQTWQTRSKNKIADFLQEDRDCLPLSSEVKDFCNEVDELKLRMDRLEAHFLSGTLYEKN